MIEYRRIYSSDVDEAAAFVIEGMRPHLYRGVRLSPAKVRSVIEHFVKSGNDFHLAAFEDDRIVGGIAALVSELPWFERSEAHVVQCRAIVPGVGRRLIGALSDWMRSDFRIRRVQFPLEFDADPRMARLLARYGFTQQVKTCVWYKGA